MASLRVAKSPRGSIASQMNVIFNSRRLVVMWGLDSEHAAIPSATVPGKWERRSAELGGV
jgi:hypothetical protein